MRKEIVAIGVVIIIVGLGLAAFGTRQVPYTAYETVEQENSSVIADESNIISANDYYAYYRDFDASEKLKIEFSSDMTCSIWLETETEFEKFENYESHTAVWVETDITNAENTVTIPNDGVYYIVVYNEYSYTVTYDLTVTEYWTTLETQQVTRYRADYTLNYVGIGVLFAGVVVAIVGAVVKPSEIEKEIPAPPPTLVTPTPEPVGDIAVSEEAPSEIFCPSCGSKVEAGTTFCPHCGAQI